MICATWNTEADEPLICGPPAPDFRGYFHPPFISCGDQPAWRRPLPHGLYPPQCKAVKPIISDGPSICRLSLGSQFYYAGLPAHTALKRIAPALDVACPRFTLGGSIAVPCRQSSFTLMHQDLREKNSGFTPAMSPGFRFNVLRSVLSKRV